MKDVQDTKREVADTVNFGPRVLYTEEFLQVWSSLPLQKRRIVRKKIALLIANPRHPSLNVHRLKRADSEVWECYLLNSFPHRLLFQHQDDKILLVQIGSHKVVNRCHVTSFNNRRGKSLLVEGKG